MGGDPAKGVRPRMGRTVPGAREALLGPGQREPCSESAPIPPSVRLHPKRLGPRRARSPLGGVPAGLASSKGSCVPTLVGREGASAGLARPPGYSSLGYPPPEKAPGLGRGAPAILPCGPRSRGAIPGLRAPRSSTTRPAQAVTLRRALSARRLWRPPPERGWFPGPPAQEAASESPKLLTHGFGTVPG